MHAQQINAGSHPLPSVTSATVLWTLAGAPSLDIGGLKEKEEDEFDHVNGALGALALSDARIAVIDRSRIRFFDTRGRQQRVIGRNGSGPGEFRYLESICQTRGDTLIAFDGGNSRVTVLTSSGDMVRQFTTAGGRVEWSACFSDGTFLVWNRAPRLAGRNMRALVRVATTGNRIYQLGSFPETEFPGQLVVPVIFVATGNSLLVADARDREIRRYDREGNLQTTYALSDHPLKTSDFGGDNIRRSVGRGINTPPSQLPVNLPSFRTLLADGPDILWVQDYRPDYELGCWSAFDLRAGTVRRLEFKAQPVTGPELLSVRGNRAFVVRRDADGAAHFNFLDLQKRK